MQHYVLKVCQLLAADQWCSQGTPVSSANKSDIHDVTEILLKVVLSTITINLICLMNDCFKFCSSSLNFRDSALLISYLMS